MISKFKKKLNSFINNKKVEKEFIKKNFKYWNKFCQSTNENKVVIEFSEKNPFELETTMRLAKTIQSKYGYKIDVLYSGFSGFREPYSRFLKSYMIDDIFYIDINYILKINVWLESYLDGLKIFSKLKTLKDIEEIEYRGIHIGDLIYDTYIRIEAKDYSPKIDKTLLKVIVNALFYCRIYDSYIDKNVKYMITIDKCYIKHGIFSRIGINKGIPVIFPAKQLKILNKDNMYRHVYHPEKDYEAILSEVKDVDINLELEKYLLDRFSGNINQIDVLTAYKDKKIYTKKSIQTLLNLDKNKKNVVIMPHAFSDFPHIDLGLFPDYYQWLIYLLEKIRDNNSVNWLIKPHPTAYFFNEVGAIENIISNMNISNVKIVPKDMSTATIKDIADIILTVRGTSGLEFSTFGIPVINAGRGCYSGFGFNIEATSIEEYDRIINNIDKVECLSDDKIYRAKVVLYYLFVKESTSLKYLYNDLETVIKNYDRALLNILQNNDREKQEDNILHKTLWEVI